MRLTKFGHACLHIEDEDASVLIDPGRFRLVSRTYADFRRS